MNKSKNNGQPVFIQHREPMLPAVDPDKRIVSPGTRRNDTEARYTLKVIFRHESSSSSSSLVGDPMDVREMDGEHRSKDAKHLQEFVVRRVEPIIEWGEKQISHALSLQVDKLTHTPYQYSPAHSRTTPTLSTPLSIPLSYTLSQHLSLSQYPSLTLTLNTTPLHSTERSN